MLSSRNTVGWKTCCFYSNMATAHRMTSNETTLQLWSNKSQITSSGWRPTPLLIQTLYGKPPLMIQDNSENYIFHHSATSNNLMQLSLLLLRCNHLWNWQDRIPTVHHLRLKPNYHFFSGVHSESHRVKWTTHSEDKHICRITTNFSL